MRSARTRGLVLTDARAPRVLGRGDLHLAVIWRCVRFTSESPVCAFKRPHAARARLKGEITGEIR